MKVRATAFGFYRQKRRPGDVFDFEGKPSQKWMEPVDAAAIEAFKKAGFKVPAPAPTVPVEVSADEKGGKVKPGKKGGSTGDENVI